MATVYAEAKKHRSTVEDGRVFLGALYYTLNLIIFTGFFELPLTINKLPIFYKQRDLRFYPSWAFSLPASIIGIPLSIVDVAVCVATTYYIIGYDPSLIRLVSNDQLFLQAFFISLLVLTLFFFLVSGCLDNSLFSH